MSKGRRIEQYKHNKKKNENLFKKFYDKIE